MATYKIRARPSSTPYLSFLSQLPIYWHKKNYFCAYKIALSKPDFHFPNYFPFQKNNNPS